MKNCLFGCVAFVSLGVVAATVYEENFQKLGDYAPGVIRDRDSVIVENEPCWGQSYSLSVRAKRDLLLWKKGIPVAKGAFDFGFGVNNNSPRGYGIVLGEETVFVTNVEKKCGGAVQVKARGGVADVFAMSNRVYRKIASVKIPRDLQYVNVFAPSGSVFSVRNVLSETPRDGFQIDTSVKRLYADFASLEQPFEGKSCEEPSVISMPDAPRAGIRLQKNKGNIAVVWEQKRIIRPKKGSKDPVREEIVAYSNLVKFVSNDTYKDGALEFPGLGRRYVLPHKWPFGERCFYGAKLAAYLDLEREWRMLPNATNAVTDIDFVKTASGTEIWINGSYVETRETTKPCSFVISGGAKYAMKVSPTAADSAYVPLDLAACPKAKAFARAELNDVKPGRQTFGKSGLFSFMGGDGKIPVDVVKPLDSQDIALCHHVMTTWALEVEEHFAATRGPLRGYPGESHFRVPAALYKKVAVVFALDPDPTKDAILTLTFGRYGNGVGANRICSTTLDCTKGVPESCKKVGEVILKGKSVPLYYTEIDIDLGKILDYTTGDYMDFEFFGKLWENNQQCDNSQRPDPSSKSSFNIFGATLVKSPVRATVVEDVPANCYTADVEKKWVAFEVASATGTAKGEVRCRILDADGKEVKEFGESYSVEGDAKKRVVADFSKFGQGWYEIFWTIREGGRDILTHRGAFGVLPPAGRNWEPTKSPYATWLFLGTGGAPTNENWAGMLLQKAGIRKASLRTAVADKYEVTSIPAAYAPNMREFGKTNFEAQVISGINKALKEKPYIDHVMVWHENAPSGFDAYHELLGLPVAEPDENTRKRNEKAAKYLNELGRIVHKNFPNLKLQIGNSAVSMGAVTYPMRGGADPSVYDSVGIETGGQMLPTERFGDMALLGMFAPRELASRWAKRPVKMNGCYEFIYRCERDIGMELHGQYQARDVLVCLAHGFTLISPGIFFDVANGYYNTVWGAAGILEREPWCYPKKSYVAYAVATKMLDDVKFVRSLDTGSSTVYALEFKRADGKTVTATWCVRGEYDFDFDGAAELTSLYGGKGTKHGSGRVTYIVSSEPLAGFMISNRKFPFEDGIFKNAQVVCDVSKESFVVEPDPDVASEAHNFFPQMKPGDITAKKVKDAERGDAVELTLKSDPEKTTHYWTEYTTLRFAKPIPIPGEPLILGIETMGNSNWGQLRFEIEDADGEVFKNLSTGSCWGCDVMDWPARLAVAFDGWGWVGQSLHRNSFFPDHSPATYEEQWQSQGGDKKIKYPIKLRAITVGMNREKTSLFGFEQAAPSIRIKTVRAR